jgi:excisionase family DNA binding protein
MRSGWGHEFNQAIVRRIREQHHLQSQYERLRARGLLTKQEIAERLDVQPDTIKKWRRAGLLRAHRFTGRGECLFELPDATSPVKHQHQGKKAALCAASKANSNRSGI